MTKKRKALGRNFTKAAVLREQRKPERKRKASEQDEVSGREAAHDNLVVEERCRDLADRFALKSAKKTADDVLEVRDRYERIVQHFRATGYVVLRDCKTAAAIKEFLGGKFVTSIKDYVKYRIRGGSYRRWWKLNGPEKEHDVTTEMMTLLALEYERDFSGLMCFLEAVLNRWRKIFEDGSLWRVRILTLRLAKEYRHDRKRILSQLQSAGEIPKDLTPDNQRAWLSKIGQFCSRDPREAIAKREDLLLRVTKIA